MKLSALTEYRSQYKGFPGGTVVKKKNHLPMQETQETWLQSLGQVHPVEEEMTTQSNILDWKISWTEEPGTRKSRGL